jgi:hypothetical protein
MRMLDFDMSEPDLEPAAVRYARAEDAGYDPVQGRGEGVRPQYEAEECEGGADCGLGWEWRGDPAARGDEDADPERVGKRIAEEFLESVRRDLESAESGAPQGPDGSRSDERTLDRLEV